MFSMTKVDIITEQTQFLLEKQQEVFTYGTGEFKSVYDLLETEKKKAEQVNAGPELASFQNVISIVAEQEKELLIAPFEEEISFLKEQLSLLEQIKLIDDEQKREELIGMILEEDTELEETVQFKVDVEQEAEEIKNEFRMLLQEIKEALLEEGIKELETFLEAARAERDDEEPDEETSECGPSCNSCQGCNIFKGLEIERDLDSNDNTDDKTA